MNWGRTQSAAADATAMDRMQRFTIARPGKICIMTPSDIDHTDDVWIHRPVDYKTEHIEKDRVIAIGRHAQKVLAESLTDRKLLLLACGIESPKNDSPACSVTVD